jgi:hypothetical protein
MAKMTKKASTPTTQSKTQRWRVALKWILKLTVPVLGILYATTSAVHVWDHLSGRSAALRAYTRLASPDGYPKIAIYDDEEDFSSLYSFLMRQPVSVEAAGNASAGHRPTCIIRPGGSIGAELGPMPPEFPDVRFVPDTLPILFGYDYARKPLPGARTIRACSLGDLRQWAQNSMDTERFWVTNVGLVLLSIVLIVIDLRKSEKVGTT